VLGYAVPMPVVVRTRAYDEVFYKQVGSQEPSEMDDDQLFREAELANQDLGF
jgi:uncharacterized protein